MAALKERKGIYVASRASIPGRAAMWRKFREEGAPIISSWIDEDKPGQTPDLGELWDRIRREIATASSLLFYAESGDLPLKGALVEVGMALSEGIPILACLPGIALDPVSFRPIGSWVAHSSVWGMSNVDAAIRFLTAKEHLGPLLWNTTIVPQDPD